MMQEATLENGGFSSDVFVNMVDQNIPHNETLKKYGRFGNCMANNRAGVVKLIVGILVVIFVAVFLRMSMGLVRLAANGLNVKAPLSAPWTKQEDVDLYIMNLITSNVAVAGKTVENVVEPMKHINMVKHISLLIIGLKGNSTDPAISQTDVLNGFLQWKPFYSSLSANFTLQHVYRLLRNTEALNKEEEVSVCYVEYGLPYNIVYLPKSDRVLYEPKIVSKSQETIKVQSACEFKTLVEKFFFANEKEISVSSFESLESGTSFLLKNESDSWTDVAKGGAVSYIDKDGTIRQQIFGVPEFQGVEHCLSLYKMLLQPLKHEIVF